MNETLGFRRTLDASSFPSRKDFAFNAKNAVGYYMGPVMPSKSEGVPLVNASQDGTINRINEPGCACSRGRSRASPLPEHSSKPVSRRKVLRTCNPKTISRFWVRILLTKFSLSVF